MAYSYLPNNAQIGKKLFISSDQTGESGREDESNKTDLLSLPPLPVEQLDKALSLLTSTIEKNFQEVHNRQFAGQLLTMTLNFLTRMVKVQCLLEEQLQGEGLTHPLTPGAPPTDEPLQQQYQPSHQQQS